MLLRTAMENTLQSNSRELIMDSASSYFGVTGNTTLNSAGDRAMGKYDYWKVVANDIDSTAPSFSWNITINK